jgi:hypothetical protein
MKLPRRRFLHLGASTATLPLAPRISSAQQNAAAQAPLDPLVWPVVPKVPAGVRSFAGHANTVPDIVGRFGVLAGLVIFTEGNHLMVLHSDDILGAFPAWAKSQPQYADLNPRQRHSRNAAAANRRSDDQHRISHARQPLLSK